VARQGTHGNPVGWLIHVASFRMVDPDRRESVRCNREALAAGRDPRGPLPPPDHDDTLTLMFMSCHPELTPASAVALTLRAVGVLGTTEIANALLVPRDDDGASACSYAHARRLWRRAPVRGVASAA
jgi:predicted RNA polymerase sigma factor